MDIANILALLIALFAVGVSIISTIGSLMKSRKESPRSSSRSSRNSQRDDDFDDEEDDEEEFEEEELTEFEERQMRKPAATPPPPPPRFSPVARGRELPPEKKFATEKFTFHAKLDDFTSQTAIEGRTIAIGLHTPDEIISDALRLAETEGTLYKTKKSIPVRDVLKKLPNKKLLWISHEIVSGPVSRRAPFPWDR
jgi:hypothetical protein